MPTAIINLTRVSTVGLKLPVVLHRVHSSLRVRHHKGEQQQLEHDFSERRSHNQFEPV